MSLENPIKSLNAEVARKIAAGEVIDRPNAIIRELMDNAIDAGASNITVEICGGGIEKIRIIDDGCGMTKEDLFNCARPHATSKISTEQDLMNLSTLGFRGEALASIAAVARLSILSGDWKMQASITQDHLLSRITPVKGTIVQSEGLFENFPARRQFLKRESAEALMCKNTFIEKAVSRPDINFTFISDGETKLILPRNSSIKERFLNAYSIREDKALFFELESKDTSQADNWKVKVVIGEPAVYRSNKKDIHIYINGRKIQEYSLVQAVEYGGQGYFPNGTYPVAAVFININPKLVDFNIHPAKKEARFYDISNLHHGLSSTIKNFFQSYTATNFHENKPTDHIRPQIFSEPSFNTHISYKNTTTPSSTYNGLRQILLNTTPNPSFTEATTRHTNTDTLFLAEKALESFKNEKKFQEEPQIRYIGACLGTFLLAEKDSNLYIIDQHAAHERILFDKIMNNQGKSQPLLIPYIIKTESKSQDTQLKKLQEQLTNIGFETHMEHEGEWHITSIPERWTGTQYNLRALIFEKHVEPQEIIRSIAAMTACKAAIKDGYVLDDDVATDLVKQAFTLPDPHCPHGRPIYTVISRQALFELVKRT